MQKDTTKIIARLVVGLLSLFAGQAAHGQAYSNAVMALNPVGYWPLNETTPPPQPLNMTAANLGTLGAAGNGYYGAWYQSNGNSFYLTNNILQSTGATADGDVAMSCPYQPGQYIVVPRNTNGVANAAITLTPPFSVESWVKTGTTIQRLGGIVSEGEVQLSGFGPNTNDPFYGGTDQTTLWAGFAIGQYSNYFFFSCFYTNNYNTKTTELDGTKNLVVNQWVHLVCTFDGTHEAMFQNGVQVSGSPKTIGPNGAGQRYVVDPTSPLMIGSGSDVSIDYGNPFQGSLDEVAIYTNILPATSITAHYQTAFGTNATYGSNYVAAVLNDKPLLYYRMDDAVGPVNAGYPTNTFPVANNYGSTGAGGNGVYQPGTTPGVAGPSYPGFGTNARAVAMNGWFGAVDVGGGNLPAALNPTGVVPMTVVSWFQTGPADAPGRFQEILGHTDNSYRLSLGQVCGENHFNPGPGPELQFTTAAAAATNGFAFNDGQWHMVAGVSDGTNEYMYMDGALAQSASNASGISIKGSSLDLMLGGDPEYTYTSVGAANTIRTFDGQIAQISFFSNALSAGQIQSLFNAAGMPPYIWSQPLHTTYSLNAGQSLSDPVGVRGSALAYQWYQNGAPAAGQTNSTLSYSSLSTNNSGSYYLVASNSSGSITSAAVSVTIYGPPVVQVQTQTNLDIFAGSSPVLSVGAVGAPPIAYQWYSNGVLIASATGSSYTVANVQNSATYTCVLTNFVSGTPVTASPIVLSVLPDPTAPYPATVIGDHPLAFWRLDESSGTSAFDYIGGNNGTYTNVVLDFTTPYNPSSATASPPSDPTEGDAPGFGIETTNNSYVGFIPTNINFATPTNVNAEFSVECWMQQYIVNTQAGILSLGYGNGGEEFTLDTGGGTATSYFLRFYVRDAAGISHNASSTFSPAVDNDWHHVVGVCDEANGTVSIYIDGTNAGSGTIPVKGGVLYSPQSLAMGARQPSAAPDYNNQLFGSMDEVAVYNYALTSAQVLAHYDAAGVKPAITQITPTTQTVNMGGTATFTATVTGTPPIAYQWTDPNNNIVSTNATLVISNVQQSSQGGYTLTVNNTYGSAQAGAYLNVNLGPPALVQDLSPATQTVTLYSGLDTISYTIVVSGTAPFSYQWHLNGNTITGATNSTYTFTALPGTNMYYVSVTNADTATQAGGNPLVSSTVTVIGVGAPQLNPASYAYRVRISFPGYTGTPVTNFPALITLSPSTIAGFNYNQFQPNGSDLRFADASGTAMLPYEIDEWNDNGLSTIWVQIPVLNGSNIWAYWGNANDTDVSPASSNVWSQAGYEVVYHMKENGFPYADSTGVYPATNGVAPTQTAGIVGHAGFFNGTSDYITPGKVTLSNQFTTYAWINISTNANNILTIWANQSGGFGNNGFSWFVDSYNTADQLTHFDSGVGNSTGFDPDSPNPTTFGQWHFVAASWDNAGNRVTNYLDAAVNGSGSAEHNFALTNQLDLGSFLDPIFEFHGVIDEARIQSGIASTNWITTTYLNIADSAFVGYTSVNLEPLLNIASSTNGYVFTWTTNYGPFTLESSTNLASPAAWTPVTTPPAMVTNGVWEQIVQPAAGSHFFRLYAP